VQTELKFVVHKRRDERLMSVIGVGLVFPSNDWLYNSVALGMSGKRPGFGSGLVGVAVGLRTEASNPQKRCVGLLQSTF